MCVELSYQPCMPARKHFTEEKNKALSCSSHCNLSFCYILWNLILTDMLTKNYKWNIIFVGYFKLYLLTILKKNTRNVRFPKEMIKPLKSEIIAWYILKRGTKTQPMIVSWNKGNFPVSKFVVLDYLQLFFAVVQCTDHFEELGSLIFSMIVWFIRNSYLVIQMNKIYFLHIFGLHS